MTRIGLTQRVSSILLVQIALVTDVMIYINVQVSAEIERRYNMNAIKFINEARRRYKATGEVCSILLNSVTPESIVQELETWSKVNQLKT